MMFQLIVVIYIDLHLLQFLLFRPNYFDDSVQNCKNKHVHREQLNKIKLYKKRNLELEGT